MMLDYLLLVGALFANASLSLFNSFFQKKNRTRVGSTQLYNLVMISSVLITWAVIWAFEGGFSLKVLPYSLIFGVGYSAAIIGLFNAIKCGPTALSTLILQLSLIATAVWGLFFWGSPVTVPVILGLILVAVSLFCCIYTKSSDSENRVSLKWIIWVSICFVGNSAASIVARVQQIDFDGLHKGQFITLATLITLVICIIMYARSDKRDTAVVLKKSGYLPILSGVLNALYSVLILVLATSKVVPASLLYPTVGVGSIALVSLFAQFVLKERMSKLQWTGLVIGAVATALLSI